jgi:hypothetical protein
MKEATLYPVVRTCIQDKETFLRLSNPPPPPQQETVFILRQNKKAKTVKGGGNRRVKREKIVF